MIRYFQIVCFLLIATVGVRASVLDSLTAELVIVKSDTAKVRVYNELFEYYMYSNPDSALIFSKEALSISEEIGYDEGIANSLNNIGFAYKQLDEKSLALEYFLKSVNKSNDIRSYRTMAIANSNIGYLFYSQSNYPKAIQYFESAVESATLGGEKQRIAQILGNIGILYYEQGLYAKALEKYLQSKTIREEISDTVGLAFVLSNIGVIYDEQKNFAKALDTYNEVLELNRKTGNRKSEAAVLANLGEVFYAQKQYDLARNYYLEALKVSEENQLWAIKAKVLNNLGGVENETGNLDGALEYLRKTLEIQNELGDGQGMIASWNILGKIEIKKGNYSEGFSLLYKSLNEAKQMGIKDMQRDNYFDIADAYAQRNDFPNAYKYLSMYQQISDSLYSEESMKQIADMQTKYDTESKENEIQRLTSDAQVQELKLNRNRILTISLIAGFSLLLVIAIIGFTSYRQRQTTKQLLIQREADRALQESERNMVSKIIETEERERKRFARDLHDGLGPLLSSIKLYVNELPADDQEAEEKENMLKYTNELIDEAVKNTRTIANNLMPTVISDYGLEKAVLSFCDKLNLTKAVNISCNFNIGDRLNKTVEIILYRVILEMINNTIRHAGAGNIEISMNMEAGGVRLEYRDDGKGFDVESVMNDPKSGLGVKNMISRIRSVNGECNISSSSSGTTNKVFIDLEYFRNT